MALMQAVSTNPLLFKVFVAKYSGDKILSKILKTLNINPESIEIDEREREQLKKNPPQGPEDQGGGQNKNPLSSAGQSMEAGINQMAEPTGGL